MFRSGLRAKYDFLYKKKVLNLLCPCQSGPLRDPCTNGHGIIDIKRWGVESDLHLASV